MTDAPLKAGLRSAFGALILLIVGVATVGAAEAPALAPSGIRPGDQAAIQRGAALFANYCSGCHSLNYMRTTRMATDLDLDEQQVMENFVFTGAKFGEPLQTALRPDQGKNWFGAAPPDLTLVARAKLGGIDWVYNFLKGFYVDESTVTGWNNTILPNVGMPNVLWELQGMQHRVDGAAHGEQNAHADGQAAEHGGPQFLLAAPGLQSPEAFDATVRDISAFLAYAGEPSAVKRQSVGLGVVLFLAAFTFLAWLLKKEFWRDVH